MNCKSCGSINGEMKSGVSKKNGKSWKGWKCSDCNEMTFLNEKKQSPVVEQPTNGNGHSQPRDLMMATSYAKDLWIESMKTANGNLKLAGEIYWESVLQVKNGGLTIMGMK